MLEQVNKKTPFELASYCLMSNHFHLQMRSKQQPISKVMSLINKRYADYYNTKSGITGHVFGKRYYDKIIDSKQGMLKVSRYIQLNPLEAGMVMMAQNYRWSSYRYYLNESNHHMMNMVVVGYFSGSGMKKRRKYQEFVDERNAAVAKQPGN